MCEAVCVRLCVCMCVCVRVCVCEAVCVFHHSYPTEEEVTGGKVDVKIKVGIFPVYSNTLDLCTLLSQVGEPCPVKPTSNGYFTTSQDVPSIIPGVS